MGHILPTSLLEHNKVALKSLLPPGCFHLAGESE